MTQLIILPGMDGTGLLLERFIAALGPAFEVRVVRYPDEASWGYAELENVARAALPDSGPIFILGESFSGPLAVMLASERPAQIQGLILCGSFVRNPRPKLAWLKPFIRLLPVSGAARAALDFLLLGKHASAEMRMALSEALKRISPATLRSRLGEVLTVNASTRFAALDMPILYLRATRDRVVPRTASELALRLNPHTRIADIDAPHFLLQAAPTQAAAAVADFARETPRKSFH
ncbi:MAG TPA: alpha/beta fold hydrolase [Gallionellaceae bacterium]